MKNKMNKYIFKVGAMLIIKAKSKKKAEAYKDGVIDGWENMDYDCNGDATFRKQSPSISVATLDITEREGK